ncbi:MAG: signal peptidase I [Patescibacteria group bacterium]
MRKTVKSVVAGLLLVFVLIIGGVVLLSGSKELFGLQVYTVTSGSMEPVIPTGSIIIVKKQSAYEVSDIATYRSSRSSAMITHRIVEVSQENGNVRFIFRGDANEDSDPVPVGLSQIKGEYLFNIPFVGYLIEFARTPVGAVVLIIIPGSILIWEEIRNVHRRLRKKTSHSKDKKQGNNKKDIDA